MQLAGFIIGCVTIAIWVVALFPFAGWINWFNIPLAAVGLVVSLTGLTRTRHSRYFGIIGTILNAAAILFGIMKLGACGGMI